LETIGIIPKSCLDEDNKNKESLESEVIQDLTLSIRSSSEPSGIPINNQNIYFKTNLSFSLYFSFCNNKKKNLPQQKWWVDLDEKTDSFSFFLLFLTLEQKTKSYIKSKGLQTLTRNPRSNQNPPKSKY
jgi:hypothetical protein